MYSPALLFKVSIICFDLNRLYVVALSHFPKEGFYHHHHNTFKAPSDSEKEE